MSFRPATSGWEAGDATGSFSLHCSPDGREKLGQQPAPPGADPRKTTSPTKKTKVSSVSGGTQQVPGCARRSGSAGGL